MRNDDMKIQLSKEDKIELLKALKFGMWDTDCTPNLWSKIKGLPSIDDKIPILSDEDIEKVIEINNELKRKKLFDEQIIAKIF